MPPASDKVRKDKKDRNRTNRKGTEIVSDSDIGTPGRSRGTSDALMDLQEAHVSHEAQAYNTQEHACRDSVQGHALVVPPNTQQCPIESSRRTSVPRTEADEKQGARLSALEEANRALTEKVKHLETHGPPRSASVLAARASLFAPRTEHSGGTSATGRWPASVHDKRLPTESADTTERRSRQCLLSGFKERLTLDEFKVLIPTLVDKHGKKVELPQNVTFSSYELFSDKVRLEFATEWDRRTCASAFISGQPKHSSCVLQPYFGQAVLVAILDGARSAQIHLQQR
eukprot:1146460-Amphidinium_carterae.1